MILFLIAVAIGLGLLIKAADEFVEGAVHLATAMNVSPFVVGAVIVGFGTSAPEMLVSGIAAAQGDRGLGVGNVIGSNVANLSLVLAAAALLASIGMSGPARRREAPMSIVAVLAFAWVVQGDITRTEGVALAIGLVLAIGWTIFSSRSEPPDVSDHRGEFSTKAEVVRTVVGLAFTILGAQALVWGALGIADELSLTGGFVGFTLVAVGTSLPELVTAVAASRRGETDLVVGNLLGSNIFNSFGVGAVIGIIGPGAIGDDKLTSTGAIIMILVALLAIAFLLIGDQIQAHEAIILLLIWVLSIVLLSGTEPDPAVSAEIAPVGVYST